MSHDRETQTNKLNELNYEKWDSGYRPQTVTFEPDLFILNVVFYLIIFCTFRDLMARVNMLLYNNALWIYLLGVRQKNSLSPGNT